MFCRAIGEFTMAALAMRVYEAAFRVADTQIGNREGL
jgi:hypothetical protein